MNQAYFKFPSTPHLLSLGKGAMRDDKVLSAHERDDFLQHHLLVEEKIDGANLGISFDRSGNLRLQNRGKYLALPFSGQWKHLGAWLEPRKDRLLGILSDQYILFGEWCYARHSVEYDSLPDWFLGFDVYDRSNSRFLAVSQRDSFWGSLGISSVPSIASGRFALDELVGMLSLTSQYSSQQVEGIYLRYDGDAWLDGRAKLVRPEFAQAIEVHWSRYGVVANRLSSLK